MAKTYLTFTLPTRQTGKTPVYGVDVLTVHEIISRTDFNIASVPGSPPFVMGMVMLRGQLMPVVDLACALGLDYIRPGPDESTTLLAFNEGSHAVAILIDKALALVNGELSDASNLTFQTPGLEGVMQNNDQLITILDLDKLVNSRVEGSLVPDIVLEELSTV